MISKVIGSNDKNTLVEILADEAFNSSEDIITYFKNLLRASHLPKSLIFDAVALLEQHPENSARKLIDWATTKGTNPEDPNFTVLGNLLYPLFSGLGVENIEACILIAIRYRLISSNVLIERAEFKQRLNHDIILEFAKSCLEDQLVEVPVDSLLEKFLAVINDLENLDVCIDAFLKTFQDASLIVDECSQVISHIKDQSFGKDYPIFLLVKLLLEDYSLPESPIRRVAEFAACLKPLVDASLKRKLTNWLKAVDKQFAYRPIEASSMKPLKHEIINAFLMIVIRKAPARSGRFHSDAFLFVEDRMGEWLSLEDEEPGPHPLKVLQARVSSFVLTAEKKLINLGNCSISIEIFLPIQQWCQEVDQWPIKVLSQKIPAGHQYRLSIRSYERISDVIGVNDYEESALLRHKLVQIWHELRSFLDMKPEKMQIHDRIARIGREDACIVSALEQRLSDGERKLSLKVVSSPPIPKVPKKQREYVFETALTKGFPMIVWSRQADTADGQVEQAIDSFLDHRNLSDLSKLLELVRQSRESNRNFGNCLVVFCDDPNRLPTEPLPLVG